MILMMIIILVRITNRQCTRVLSILVEIEGNFVKLSESVISASNINPKEMMEALVPMVKDEVIATVKKEVKDEVLPPVKATWNAIQAQKVFEHEHSMLVLGLQTDKPPHGGGRGLA